MLVSSGDSSRHDILFCNITLVQFKPIRKTIEQEIDSFVAIREESIELIICYMQRNRKGL